MKVNIDKHGYPSSSFNFTCHGDNSRPKRGPLAAAFVPAKSGTKRRFSEPGKPTQLLMQNGKVNRPLAYVCKGGLIRVAWNEIPGLLDVDTEENKMVEFLYDGSQQTNHLTFPHEILTSFLMAHQLSPTYMWARQNWGGWSPRSWWWDEETEQWVQGQWTGAVREVRGDINVVLVCFNILL